MSTVELAWVGPQEGNVTLNVANGKLEGSLAKRTSGTVLMIHGKPVAVYAQEQNVFLQIGARRWDLDAAETQLTFRKEPDRLFFAIGAEAFEAPRNGLDEAHLEYIFNVWSMPELRRELLERTSQP